MKQIKLRDAELQVVDRGSGSVVLLVHGFPLDHTLWAHQIDELSSTYRVIAPDLRGFGRSQTSSECLTMEGFADDLAQVLEQLEIDTPVTFCGLSMGGYIAWPFFQRHRQRLASLILCNTRAAADTSPVAKGRYYLADRVLSEGTRGPSREMLQKLLAPRTCQQLPGVAQQVLDVMSTTSPNSVAMALRAMAQRPDMTSALPDIDCPTLVLCGREDQVTPPDEMQAMASQMPNAVFRIIADAGHLTPLENPTAVNREMGSFLHDLSAAEARG